MNTNDTASVALPLRYVQFCYSASIDKQMCLVSRGVVMLGGFGRAAFVALHLYPDESSSCSEGSLPKVLVNADRSDVVHLIG